MATTTTLKKAEWGRYFSELDVKVREKRVHVEVVGGDIGDQLVVRSAPLLGLVYEVRQDSLAIVAEGITHVISKPEKISVLEKAEQLPVIDIIDSQKRHQILSFTAA